ncbi:SCO6880 family protein [Streptacidiphilus sp. PAMC 29251]
MSETPSASRTYFGWQQEKVAFMFGMSAQRAAMLGGGVLLAIWPLAASRIQAGIVTWPLSLLLVALAYVRIAGRTVDEWAVAYMSFTLLRNRRQNRFLSGPFNPAAKAASDNDAPTLDLPGILAPLTILEADTGSGQTMAVIHNRTDRTFVNGH